MEHSSLVSCAQGRDSETNYTQIDCVKKFMWLQSEARGLKILDAMSEIQVEKIVKTKLTKSEIERHLSHNQT